MFDPITLIIAPIIVVVLGLVIEYWVIQPLRMSKNESLENESNSLEIVSATTQSRITRLLYASVSYNASQFSSKFIEGAGYFFVIVPVFIASVFATLLAIPLFVALYMSEKLGSCIYKPTCKEYLVQSIELHGPLKGLWLGSVRFLRCNPFFHGGYDPVSTRGRFSKRQSTEFERSRFGVNLKRTLKGLTYVICLTAIGYRLLERFFPQQVFLSMSHLSPIVYSISSFLLISFVIVSMAWINGWLLVKLERYSWVVAFVLIIITIATLIWV